MSEETTTDGMQRRAAELLARAEDFRRHGEDGSADAALALAEKIMIKYALDAALVSARLTSSDRPVEPIVFRTIEVGGIYRVVLAPQLSLLALATGAAVRAFTSRRDKITDVCLVGYESEVLQLVALLTSIQLQAIAGVSNWWRQLPEYARSSGMVGYKDRRQFVRNFVEGARERVELARVTALGSAGPGTELAVASRRRPVDEYVDERFTLSSGRSRVDPGSRSAADAGHAAGRRANTGDPAVGNVRRQLGR